MTVIYILLAGVIGAILYWVRGRGWKDILGPWAGTNTFARPVWAVPTGTLLWLGGLSPELGQPAWLFLAIAVVWAGLFIPHAAGQDLGEVSGTYWLDVLILTAVGGARMLLLSLYLAITGNIAWAFLPLLISPLHGLACVAGDKLPKINGDRFQLWDVIWGSCQWICLAYIVTKM